MSGNASLQNPLVVGMLNLSGNVALTQTAAGSDGSGDTSGIANTLLAGNLSVYINDPSGLFTADELARIQDAINAWDALLVPYNVTITEVSDPSLANLVIDTGTTSACGGVADGVLGCYNAPNSEITMIQGWNWYAGADPTQIGAGQYDFETTVTPRAGPRAGPGRLDRSRLADVRDAGGGRGRPDRDHAGPEHPRPARRGRPADGGRIRPRLRCRPRPSPAAAAGSRQSSPARRA